MISREVRLKLDREQRRVLALLHDLRVAAEAGDTDGLVERAAHLEASLDAHLALVSYVLEAISDDEPLDPGSDESDSGLNSPGVPPVS